MKLTTASEKYGIKHRVNCENEKPCEVDVVLITDVNSDNDNKKQVYISGALHGDEVIGPNVAYYFIEYILMSAKDKTIERLLSNMEIIVTPMTNAVGYYHKEREERLSNEA